LYTDAQGQYLKNTAKKNPEKGRGVGHVTPKNFGVHPNISPKGGEIKT